MKREMRCSEIILRGDCFQLRPWKVEDALWYVESRDDEVFRWTSEKRDLTLEATEKAIRSIGGDPNAIGLAISDRMNEELLGNVALSFRQDDDRCAEIMYWLAPGGRGRGVATGAVKLLSRWAFDVLKLERIRLKMHPENVRSRSVATRAGYVMVEIEDRARSDMKPVWFELRRGRITT